MSKQAFDPSAGVTDTSGINGLLPVFLKLQHLRVLIIGGSSTGLERLNAVVVSSPAALVRLVAIHIDPAIQAIALANPQVQLGQRAFVPADIAEADIVIAAVNDRETRQEVHNLARQYNKLVNVAGAPDLCDFYLDFDAAKKISSLHKAVSKAQEHLIYKAKKPGRHARALVENNNAVNERRWKRIATYSLAAFGLMLTGHFIFSYIPLDLVAGKAMALSRQLDATFPVILLAGFLAQMVDGALGMGYGITSTSILLSIGVPPVTISGSVHAAEIFASGASGYSHYRFGNVNKKLVRALLIPGVAGAVAGALLLVYLGNEYAGWISPVLATYTLVMGIKILSSAFRKQRKKKFRRYGLLAGTGGFLDSFGGGGWGPIVTTTLITKGRTPKYVVGSVSLSEFFITLASAFSFFIMLGVTHWQTITGLVIGGLLAAPLAAKLAGRLPRKASFILLGMLVIIWSIRILVKLL